MAIIRPAAFAASRLFESVSVKAVLVACLSVTTWHYIDAGDIKTLHQKVDDQDVRLEKNSKAIVGKVDRDTYTADRQDTNLQLHEIREREDKILELLLEKPHE